MARIDNVWVKQHRDIVLEIDLSNGQTVWIPLRNRIGSRYFKYLVSNKDNGVMPQTDGSRIFGPKGLNLSFEKIMEMVEGYS